MPLRSSHLCPPGGLESIQHFFVRPPLQHLGLELAVCWVLERLLEADSYPTALLQDLTRLHPRLRLSETVLQQALFFLVEAGAISSYSQRCPSRGRPRRMLHLLDGQREEALALMPPWRHWLQENATPITAGSHAPSPGLHPAAHAAAGRWAGVLPAGCQ
ncbi:helix-turn-helix transcriptional regulator [Vulcanococcus limneticus Candia 3F8]|uniref:helix-turn-helix transcriptional regulator n=1 Tax=Vulcanococcus limneticus TaxID=2170428 RepID=UPI000B99492E|nr:helix-turn-helix transcriptional regulator [Vulcanococcus limneticus]MCP9793181.1 helix-turn-helix transcriptional regulator [Vulcanococcus limneticus MW73D5]MCP9895187.1 helix-turn-helix transcriptional regulator [Vulcanococcus limneticus Candia 3F8]MCP9898579.1 helix-turn-helix transcriptional regulator [Vulcanococcus limneticus Candia 3B3]